MFVSACMRVCIWKIPAFSISILRNCDSFSQCFQIYNVLFEIWGIEFLNVYHLYVCVYVNGCFSISLHYFKLKLLFSMTETSAEMLVVQWRRFFFVRGRFKAFFERKKIIKWNCVKKFVLCVLLVANIALSLNLNKALKLVKALSLTELESFTNAKFKKNNFIKKNEWQHLQSTLPNNSPALCKIRFKSIKQQISNSPIDLGRRF